ncbi:unnamed protein product [marine sediment metagenome]|uniref:Uncharacterized protein n=1 Tax=marine sediment metagenome TaxID=412755 RepID=X0YR03_9ZZZZ
MSSDKVQFAVSATPIESVGTSQQGSVDSFIVASEVGRSIGGSGEVLSLATGWDGSGGAAHGYDDGVPYYISSAKATTPTAFSALTDFEFAIIKHSGHIYSSATVLGAVNTTDYLTIRATHGTDGTDVTGASGLDNGEQPVIAVLKAGEATSIPMRDGAMSMAYFGHHSTEDDGSTAGANTIAIEFFAVK